MGNTKENAKRKKKSKAVKTERHANALPIRRLHDLLEKARRGESCLKLGKEKNKT